MLYKNIFLDRAFRGNQLETIGGQNLDFRYLHMQKRGQGSFHSMHFYL